MKLIVLIVYSSFLFPFFYSETEGNIEVDNRIEDEVKKPKMDVYPKGFIKNNGNKWRPSFTDYLPIEGGTLTGNLNGTSATFSGNVSLGTGSYRWSNNQYLWSSGPHLTPSNSITLFDQYTNLGGSGSPSSYGTILDIHGRPLHLNSQLYFGESGQVLYRSSFYGATAWSSWQKFLTDNNISDYALPLSGGTLTGNLSVGTGAYRWSNNQYLWSSGPHATPSNSITLFDQYSDDGGPGSPTNYGTILDINGRPSHLNSQLYFGESGQLYYRSAFYGQSAWSLWQRLITDSNIGDYSLPKTGGTLTGTLNGTSAKFSNQIRTSKVIVTQSGWPDYVFSPDYKLPTLTELSVFIKQNRHLPDIPSAREVDENGVNVGDNQALLLKKIEEMTLYLIELKEENDKMRKDISGLQKKIKTFTNEKK